MLFSLIVSGSGNLKILIVYVSLPDLKFKLLITFTLKKKGFLFILISTNISTFFLNFKFGLSSKENLFHKSVEKSSFYSSFSSG
jgi:hypothetical protein